MFAGLGLGQMHMWAQGKKKNYRKLFGKEYKCLFIMIPFPFL